MFTIFNYQRKTLKASLRAYLVVTKWLSETKTNKNAGDIAGGWERMNTVSEYVTSSGSMETSLEVSWDTKAEPPYGPFILLLGTYLKGSSENSIEKPV